MIHNNVVRLNQFRTERGSIAVSLKAKTPEKTPEERGFSTKIRGISLPVRERGVHYHTVTAWERHKANLTHTNPRTRQRAWDALTALEGGLADGPERDWRLAAIAETVALAKARGEEVEAGREGQKTRILSRGGFDAAKRKGYLDGLAWSSDGLWDIGTMYQDCFERREGQTTPDRGAAGGRGREGPQHAILHSGEVLTILRSGQSAQEILALDLIVAMDLSVLLAAMVVGRHRLTMIKRLRSGLCAASQNWRGRPKEEKSKGQKAAELILKHQVILAAQRSVA